MTRREKVMQKKCRNRLLTLVALSLVSAFSSSVNASDTSNVSALRFLGARADRTSNYIIFESSVKTLVTSSNRRPEKAGFLLTADLGLMHNIDSTRAAGASFYISADDYGFRIGLRPRYRRWLGKHATIDISAGLLLAGYTNYRAYKFLGYVASASIGSAGWFSVDAHVEVLSLFRGSEKSVYLGASGRGFLAFVPAVFIATVLAATKT